MRVYKGEQDVIWGGEDSCRHEWGDEKIVQYSGQGRRGIDVNNWAGDKEIARKENEDKECRQGTFCQKCGAWKGAFGLEPTMDCGRPLMTLRNNLTAEEREYAISELRRLGLYDDK